MNNRERIEQIYQLYEQKMYRIAYSILGNSYDAEDAVQDAFLKLVRLVKKLDDPTSVRTKRFVIRTIQSTSIDRYRRNQKEHKNRTNQEMDTTTIEIMSHEDLLVDKQDLRTKLLTLPKEQRDMVVLHVINGMSMDEIAKEKQVSTAAVRKRYERGIRQLRFTTGEK